MSSPSINGFNSEFARLSKSPTGNLELASISANCAFKVNDNQAIKKNKTLKLKTLW
jgi:hypothetical protein